MKKTFLPILLFAFVACNSVSPEDNKRLTKIDSLQVVLDTIDMKLADWKEYPLEENARNSEELFLTLEKNYPDKEDRYFWISQMSNLKRVYRGFTKFEKAEKTILAKLPVARTQLTGLKNSIEENVLSEKQKSEYMVIEENEVNTIYDLYNRYYYEAEVAVSMWDSLKVKMSQIKMNLDTLG